MLDEEEEAARPQHAPHLVRVRDKVRVRGRDRVRVRVRLRVRVRVRLRARVRVSVRVGAPAWPLGRSGWQGPSPRSCPRRPWRWA